MTKNRLLSALDRIEHTLDQVEIRAREALDSLDAAHTAASATHDALGALQTTLQQEREALTATRARLSHVEQEAEAVVGIMDSVLALAASDRGETEPGR